MSNPEEAPDMVDLTRRTDLDALLLGLEMASRSEYKEYSLYLRQRVDGGFTDALPFEVWKQGGLPHKKSIMEMIRDGEYEWEYDDPKLYEEWKVLMQDLDLRQYIVHSEERLYEEKIRSLRDEVYRCQVALRRFYDKHGEPGKKEQQHEKAERNRAGEGGGSEAG